MSENTHLPGEPSPSKVWFTAEELVALDLPGLPKRVSEIHEMAMRQGWKRRRIEPTSSDQESEDDGPISAEELRQELLEWLKKLNAYPPFSPAWDFAASEFCDVYCDLDEMDQ